MSKKYTVEVEAKVEGSEDVKMLEQNLQGVATEAENANLQLESMNETTKEASGAQKGLTETTDSAAFSTLQLGLAAYNVNKIYQANQPILNKYTNRISTAGRLLRTLTKNYKLLGTALIGAVLAIKTYNRLLDASHNFITSNTKAMNEWRELLVDDVAMRIFRNNIELYIGEGVWTKIERPIRTFWTNVKLTFLENIGDILLSLQSAELSMQQSRIMNPDKLKESKDAINAVGKEIVDLAKTMSDMTTNLIELSDGYALSMAKLAREASKYKNR